MIRRPSPKASNSPSNLRNDGGHDKPPGRPKPRDMGFNLISGVALLTAAASGSHLRHVDAAATAERVSRRRAPLQQSLRQPLQQPLMQLRGGVTPGFDEPVLLVENEEQLDYELELAGSKLVVLDFYADWCGPCKKLSPVLDDLARKTAASDKVIFLKVCQHKTARCLQPVAFQSRGRPNAPSPCCTGRCRRLQGSRAEVQRAQHADVTVRP